MTKISKDLIWLAPFIKRVKHLVPMGKLHSIKSYKVPLTKSLSQYAALLKWGNNICYTMMICTHDHRVGYIKNGGFIYTEQVRFPIAHILDNLAHELAHLKHWEHTPAHYKLQVQIMFEFWRVLEAKKVKNTWQRTIVK